MTLRPPGLPVCYGIATVGIHVEQETQTAVS